LFPDTGNEKTQTYECRNDTCKGRNEEQDISHYFSPRDGWSEEYFALFSDHSDTGVLPAHSNQNTFSKGWNNASFIDFIFFTFGEAFCRAIMSLLSL
jgi:hypothetical protein